MALNAYVLNWSDSLAKAPITIAAETTNTVSSSLTLIGQGTLNYGESQQENMLRMLENFASASEPMNPTVGQLWYNTNDTISVFNGTTWGPLAYADSVSLLSGVVSTHMSDQADVHPAIAISYSHPTVPTSVVDIKLALDHLVETYANKSYVDFNIGLHTAPDVNLQAHKASQITFASTSGLSSTTVQTALDEIASEFATSAALAGTNSNVQALTTTVNNLNSSQPRMYHGYADRQIYSGTASQLYTFAHGMGSISFMWEVFWECIFAESGWSVGDIVKHPNMEGTGNYSLSQHSDATNFYIRIGSLGVLLPNKTTGSGVVINPNRWKLFVNGIF